MVFEQALETVYRIKREYRAERDERRKLANTEVRERFAASHRRSQDRQIHPNILGVILGWGPVRGLTLCTDDTELREG